MRPSPDGQAAGLRANLDPTSQVRDLNKNHHTFGNVRWCRRRSGKKQSGRVGRSEEPACPLNARPARGFLASFGPHTICMVFCTPNSVPATCSAISVHIFFSCNLHEDFQRQFFLLQLAWAFFTPIFLPASCRRILSCQILPLQLAGRFFASFFSPAICMGIFSANFSSCNLHGLFSRHFFFLQVAGAFYQPLQRTIHIVRSRRCTLTTRTAVRRRACWPWLQPCPIQV